MIAITGATGLLGSLIAKKLIDEGLELICTRRSNSKIIFDHPKISWVEADILDISSLSDAFKDVDTVVHAAALVSFHSSDAEELLKVNVEGTSNVVNCCLTAGVKRLIHISSVAALGRQKGVEFLNENNKWVDSPLNSDYAESKYLSELEIFRGHEEGLEIDIINPSLILSQADWNKSSAQIFKYVWKQRPFYTDSFLNYVDARDVANIVFQMIGSAPTNTKYIVNGGTIPLKDLLFEIANRLNRRPPWIKVNSKIIYLGVYLEAILAWVTRQKPLVTLQSARSASDKFQYSNQKVIDKYGFQFRPLNETLDWCCDYYVKTLQ